MGVGRWLLGGGGGGGGWEGGGGGGRGGGGGGGGPRALTVSLTRRPSMKSTPLALAPYPLFGCGVAGNLDLCKGLRCSPLRPSVLVSALNWALRYTAAACSPGKAWPKCRDLVTRGSTASMKPVGGQYRWREGYWAACVRIRTQYGLRRVIADTALAALHWRLPWQ